MTFLAKMFWSFVIVFERFTPRSISQWEKLWRMKRCLHLFTIEWGEIEEQRVTPWIWWFIDVSRPKLTKEFLRSIDSSFSIISHFKCLSRYRSNRCCCYCEWTKTRLWIYFLSFYGSTFFFRIFVHRREFSPFFIRCRSISSLVTAIFVEQNMFIDYLNQLKLKDLKKIFNKDEKKMIFTSESIFWRNLSVDRSIRTKSNRWFDSFPNDHFPTIWLFCFSWTIEKFL